MGRITVGVDVGKRTHWPSQDFSFLPNVGGFAAKPGSLGDLVELARIVARLDNAAAEIGRDPGAIRRVLNVSGEITAGASAGSCAVRWTSGVDELAFRAAAHGFDTFIFWGEGGRQMARFAEEVAPAVRNRIASARQSR